MEAFLESRNIARDSEFAEIRVEVASEVAEAHAFAQESSFPRSKDIMSYVFAGYIFFLLLGY